MTRTGPRPARRATVRRAAALAAALLAAGALVATAAAPARAQSLDTEAIDRALAEGYLAEPADPDSLRVLFGTLKVKNPRNFRVEAGLALAEAAAALRDDDEAAAGRAYEAGEKAASLNPDHRLSQRAAGLGALVAGRIAKKRRDRKQLLERAVRSFDRAAERPSPERWLDTYWKARALLLLGDEAGAAKAAAQAGMLLDEEAPGALGAGGKARAKALTTALVGRARASAGNFAGAAEELRRAVEAAPDDLALRVELGLMLERTGASGEAAKELAAALAAPLSGPAALPVRHRREAARALARLEVAAGAESASLAAIEPYAATTTALAGDLALRAALRRVKGDLDGALEDARAALRRDSFCVEAWATRAEVILARPAPAAGRAAAELEEALAAAQSAAAFEPRSPERADLLSRALGAAGRDADAAAAAARAKELAAARDALRAQGKEHSADTAVRDARRYLADGRAEEALEAAAHALAADPSDGLAEVARAQAHLGLVPPKTVEARAAAAAVAARFPSAHGAHVLEAEAALLAGDQTAARAAAEKALRLEPESVAARRILTGGAEAPGAEQKRKLPPELADAARRLQSADPLERANAAHALTADPAGLDLVVAQVERDPDPFVVGVLANLLAEKGERRAAQTLMRIFHALPISQTIARGRVLRALGRVGDPSVLPEVLSAILGGQVESAESGHAAVLSLLSGLDEMGSILFQRELVESEDGLRRTLAPVLAEHILKDRLEKAQADATDAAALLGHVRIGLLLVLFVAGYARVRFWQKERQLEKLADAQRDRTTRRVRKDVE